MVDSRRRRVLVGTVTALTASLAGCSDDGGGGGNNSSDNESGGGGGGY